MFALRLARLRWKDCCPQVLQILLVQLQPEDTGAKQFRQNLERDWTKGLAIQAGTQEWQLPRCKHHGRLLERSLVKQCQQVHQKGFMFPFHSKAAAHVLVLFKPIMKMKQPMDFF